MNTKKESRKSGGCCLYCYSSKSELIEDTILEEEDDIAFSTGFDSLCRTARERWDNYYNEVPTVQIALPVTPEQKKLKQEENHTLAQV